MSQELIDFKHFKQHQLINYDPETGCINSKSVKGRKYYDIGSLNDDGYVRVWANGSLRMKHRLVYWLYHGELPKEGYEIDHKDSDRSNNAISNLQILSKADNNCKSANRKFGKQLTTEQVHKVCELLANTELSDLAIANIVGRSRCTVRDIKTRRTRSEISKDYSWPHRE